MGLFVKARNLNDQFHVPMAGCLAGKKG